jgi:hypothetical protein
MTDAELITQIATLDRNVANWIKEARASGMSDKAIVAAFKRATKAVEAERGKAA